MSKKNVNLDLVNQPNSNSEIDALKQQVEDLKRENNRLKEQLDFTLIKQTVIVPDSIKEIFNEAEKKVAEYFSDAFNTAENGEIVISGERYVLFRSASLSYEFLDIIKELYNDKGAEEAVRIGNNFLFDIAHVLGRKDAKSFQVKMKMSDPMQKLSAGPVHFAYTGWANVEILPESNPTPDENFYLKFHHHNSFEAQSWKKANRKSDIPVCVMNSGYASGWCEESFGMPLTSVEITCEAKGDANCTFIMAPPHKIESYLKESNASSKDDKYEIPIFFKRKVTEDKLRESLVQKETLLKEVHHRVKNNLQIISSLFRLQLNNIKETGLRNVFLTSLNRINTMALIHELIYGDKDLTSVNLKYYIEQLMSSLTQLYYIANKEVKVEYDFDLINYELNADKAIPFGLILNEIASNSFKYATNGTSRFVLSLKDDEQFYYFTFSDNGPGLPKDTPTNTLGLSLINILSEQIDADLKVDSSDKGLTYSIKFKK